MDIGAEIRSEIYFVDLIRDIRSGTSRRKVPKEVETQHIYQSRWWLEDSSVLRTGTYQTRKVDAEAMQVNYNNDPLSRRLDPIGTYRVWTQRNVLAYIVSEIPRAPQQMTFLRFYVSTDRTSHLKNWTDRARRDNFINHFLSSCSLHSFWETCHPFYCWTDEHNVSRCETSWENVINFGFSWLKIRIILINNYYYCLTKYVNKFSWQY